MNPNSRKYHSSRGEDPSGSREAPEISGEQNGDAGDVGGACVLG